MLVNIKSLFLAKAELYLREEFIKPDPNNTRNLTAVTVGLKNYNL